MSGGLQHSAGVAVCLLSVAVAVLHASSCDFQPSCRPGETYRLAIPCEGKCTSYVQCTDGAATEKKCGKWIFSQTRFDPVKLDCVRNVDCDWWKKIVTTTVAPSTTPSTAAPSSTPAPETTTPAPASSTESTSTTSSPTVTPDSTAMPSSTSAAPIPTAAPSPSPTAAPTSPPSPAESAAAPVAAVGPALLAAALAMLL